ncbi:MAG: UDP-N-acetylmuramate dehydrogenase [Terriglobales bacterium]
MNIRENVPLAPLTTLGVGGPARYFVEAANTEEVRRAVDFARSRQLSLFVLGGGSNVVVADTGFPGLVLKIAIRGVTFHEEHGTAIFTVGAGEDWDMFVADTVARNCAGIECLSGIPGTVGGTPVQNVGAYGQEVSDTIRSVSALDLTTGETRDFDRDECEFTYRGSRFNTSEPGRYVILHVTFALQPGGRSNVTYADLTRSFGKRQPTLAEVRAAVRDIRRSKGMLIVSDDDDCHSAGSFFKNPVLSSAAYRELQQRVAARGLAIPAYPALASQHKVPAAWLVEQAGFPKGYTHGPAGISRKHALAIINRGGATAADILALKSEIQCAVRDRFGVELHPEPVFVGFEEEALGP